MIAAISFLTKAIAGESKAPLETIKTAPKCKKIKRQGTGAFSVVDAQGLEHSVCMLKVSSRLVPVNERSFHFSAAHVLNEGLFVVGYKNGQLETIGPVANILCNDKYAFASDYFTQEERTRLCA